MFEVVGLGRRPGSAAVMRDLASWNLSLGRWAGIRIRLHAFFVLFAVLALYFAAQEGAALTAAAGIGLLFASVLLHEFGHCWSAWAVDGSAEQIVIWPFGGLTPVNVSHDPKSERTTALAGPLANLLVCFVLAPALVYLSPDVLKLLNPLTPPWNERGLTVTSALEWTFWVNWIVFLMNVALPAFPLDGGRIWRSLLWPRCGYRSAVVYVSMAAKLTAVLLGVAAWLCFDDFRFATLPLAILAVLIFFNAKQDADRLHDHDLDDVTFGYDFSEGYTSLEQPSRAARDAGPGPLRQWLDSRREARLVRQRQVEEEEERRVDEVLARLHEFGRDSLSDDDRRLLDRVSARYRNRQQG